MASGQLGRIFQAAHRTRRLLTIRLSVRGLRDFTMGRDMHIATRLTAITIVATSCALLPPRATAQSSPTVRTESRDAALAYIGTMNFIVGRISRDCLKVVGRSESPQEVVQNWQQRNAKYVMAAAKYMETILDNAQTAGGAQGREVLLNKILSASRAPADAMIRGWIEKDGQEVACKRSVQLVDANAFDVSPRVPMFTELESLADQFK
jgi:hypothetical protein